MANGFAHRVVQLGGGGGRSERSLQERPILEQTIGSIVLDRLNGYPVGSVADIYKGLGGENPTVLKVLEDAFGTNFDEVAAHGREYVIGRVKSSLKAALAAENLVAPTTKGFRDMLLHLDADPKFDAFRKINRMAKEDGGE